MKILIADDDVRTRQMLCKAMQKAGFEAVDAKDGDSALAHLRQQPFSVMILDMHMPHMDGVETMRQACQIQPNLQIIVLTGNPTVDNAIASIKANVADYFVKPVDLLALVAAISRAAAEQSWSDKQQALLDQLSSTINQIPQPTGKELGRIEQVSHASARLDEILVYPLTLNKSHRLLIFTDKPHEPIRLSRGETAVLYTLMHHANRILSCSQIVQRTFGYDASNSSEAENVVRPYISRLRQKIEENARHPKYLQTVHGHGYRFVGNNKENIQTE
ncbi:MAG: response regulator transcription factor [Chloroflexota bacterium]